MWVMFFVILLVLCSAFVFSKHAERYPSNPDKARKQYIIFVSIVLILQSGLRHVAVGADTYAYYLDFEQTKAFTWSSVLENFKTVYVDGIGKDPGHPLLEKIFQIFSSEYRVFLFFIAICFFSAFAHFVYKNTRKIQDAVIAYILYLALFYAFFSITGIRQTFATAIALSCFELIKRKRFLSFLFFILIAATVHKSVLLFLPFYFIAHFKKIKVAYIATLVLLPLLFVIRQPLAFWIASVSGSSAYMAYVENVYENAGAYTFTAFLLLTLLLSGIYMKRVLAKFPEAYPLYNALLLSALFAPFTWINPSLMRIVQYFSIFLVLFIPLMIRAIPYEKKVQESIPVVVIIILVFLCMKTVTEYNFMWEEMSLGPNYD
jgi:transmembrane protein EpsG